MPLPSFRLYRTRSLRPKLRPQLRRKADGFPGQQTYQLALPEALKNAPHKLRLRAYWKCSPPGAARGYSKRSRQKPRSPLNLMYYSVYSFLVEIVPFRSATGFRRALLDMTFWQGGQKIAHHKRILKQNLRNLRRFWVFRRGVTKDFFFAESCIVEPPGLQTYLEVIPCSPLSNPCTMTTLGSK